MCKFSSTLYNRQLLQFARVRVEFCCPFYKMSKMRESNHIFLVITFAK